VLDEAGQAVDYVYLSANPAFETHTGLRVADILGRRASEVMQGVDSPPFMDIYSRVVQTGEPASFEQYSEPMGRYYFTNVYRVDEGCFATIFVDITERKLSEIALQEKNAVLDSFNNTISHDLKSPLITIQSFAGMIARDMEAGDHTRARDDMKMIEGAAAKMTALLNDLLALSKIGKMMHTPTQIDMNQLVRDVLAQLAGPLGNHRIQLAVQPDLTPMQGDQVRIAEVVQNLVENAIKYMGDQAAPRIVIGSRDDGQGPIFFVRDNGLGIEPDHQENIFGLFNKLDAKSEGYGVGLALVKQIIEAHGGRVWVTSDGAGRGCEFCFTLPGSVL
jgi:signal transduction histidine kinase